MNKYIHIVCPEVPHLSSAADMTDTLRQVQLLHAAGYRIILHCFHEEEAPDTTVLQNITYQLHLYERNQGHKGLSIRHPYCVSSRSDPALLENLLQYECPVLFQGMSSTFYLPTLAERGYKTFVRLNGVKSELYQASTRCEKSLLKKAYSFNESRLIKKWEEKIAELAVIIPTTLCDQQKFQELYKNARTKYLAPFIPAPEINSLPGMGMYCLYYGDMSNPENEKMVHWLSENVFSKIHFPFIVADTNTSVKSQDQLHPESNICWVQNASPSALNELIQKAQVVMLPRNHSCGFDKRLLQALEKGRHCICNDLMINDTGLERLFIIANDCYEMKQSIEQYFSKSFTEQDIRERENMLSCCNFSHRSVKDLAAIIDA